jgi:uncharacterized protein involved in type VI secretion and phage assembly
MSQINGVVIGLVTNVQDPSQNGRIKVHFPWLDDQHETDWIRIATMMGGNGRGSFFMPEVNDEVLVAFDHGDVRFPYVVGFMWNGQDQTPTTDLQLRVIRSVNGHEIRLYDPPVQNGDQGYVRIQYSRGGGSVNIVELANGGITISSDSAVQIIAPNVMINGRVVAPTSGPI